MLHTIKVYKFNGSQTYGRRSKEMKKINVFAINLVKRTDRKASILSEFSEKEEFQLNLAQAIEHPVGAVGLWQALRGIVERVSEEDFGLCHHLPR